MADYMKLTEYELQRQFDFIKRAAKLDKFYILPELWEQLLVWAEKIEERR